MNATAELAGGGFARATAARAARLPRWWPLAALTIAAAVLRLSTLGLQSFWYDEAYTPVHVLHASLFSTLRSVVHTENTPPLWYLLAWLCSRVLGTGEVALRLPSALAGIGLVPVAWAIGGELLGRHGAPADSLAGPHRAAADPSDCSRRCAIACAALAAFNPLFVWYAQEARAYELLALTSALALLFFLRCERDPSTRNLVWFAITGALALLSHYFAVFLLVPMALWLLREPGLRRRSLPALAAIGAVGLALVPLISAQGGHGTQWIGRWPLGERLQAIPQYYLLGASGEPLGHGVELLVALPLLAAGAVGLWGLAERPSARAHAAAEAGDGAGAGAPAARTPERAVVITATIAAAGILLPLALVAFGSDYLAPRNLVGAMVPLTALVAVLGTAPQARRAGPALLAAGAVAFAAIAVDVDLSPRLQRGDWRGVADALRAPLAGRAGARAITTVELGSAPLEYYLPGLHNLRRGRSVLVSEIDETGYAPLRSSAGEPPAPGFALRQRIDVHGLITYRFLAPSPQLVTDAQLRRHVITLAQPEVLVPANAAEKI
jgi:mannosyltransferase